MCVILVKKATSLLKTTLRQEGFLFHVDIIYLQRIFTVLEIQIFSGTAHAIQAPISEIYMYIFQFNNIFNLDI